MAQRLIDVVSKALGPNTAIVYVTVFGSRNTVMIMNASTKRLIATVYRSVIDGGFIEYRVSSGGLWCTTSLDDAVHVLQRLVPQGKNRNYSHATYKEAWV